MKSDLAKVLHEVCGVPMIRYVVGAALAVVSDVVVVIGYQADRIRKALKDLPHLRFALQEDQIGTGHAVMTALPKIPEGIEDVVILCGDTPFIKGETIRALIGRHKALKASLTLAITRLEEPGGYGRIICDGQGRLMRVVEESDASAEERKIKEVNSGTYCVKIGFLKEHLPHLDKKNVQREFYLTDLVAAAYQNGLPAAFFEAPDSLQVLGINTQEELAHGEQLFQTVLKRESFA